MLLILITCFKWETQIKYNIKVGCGIPDDDGHQPVAKGHLKDSGDLQTAIKAD